MAVGLQRTARRALLTRLKADSTITALVPATKIHPDGQVEWPFIQLRSPVTQPLRASCVKGGTISWDIHAFAMAKKDGNSVTVTAESHAGEIGAAIEACLDGKRIAVEGGGTMRIRLSDIRLLEDGDRNSFHWFAQVNCRVLAE